MKKLVKVVIDRKRWLRGSGYGSLRNKSGKQCCLGFACRALGQKAKDILGFSMPGSLSVLIPGLTECGGGQDTDFSRSAARINDDVDLSDKDREKQLKALARENGFNFTFK